jgi:hypothetical protein
MTEKKVCNTCGEIKPLECFNKDTRSRDNKVNICKPCVHIRDEKRKAKKKEERKLSRLMMPI